MRFNKLIVAAFATGVIVSLASVSALADTGWKQNDDGSWKYYTSEDQYVTGWKSIDGNWFYFDEFGDAFINRWVLIDGGLYHFDSNGHMEKNKWVDCGEYHIRSMEEKYASANAEYANALKEYRNKREWRYVGADGKAYIGWKKVDGEWYYFNDADDGVVFDNTYYFRNYDSYGMMHYGWLILDDFSKYNFDGNGRYRKNCWYKGADAGGDVSWYYFGSDGLACDGWAKINGSWYYFDNHWSGTNPMKTGKFYEYGESYGYYIADSNGKLITGPKWYKLKEEDGKDYWCYIKDDGSLATWGWMTIGGKNYYFDSNGHAVTNVSSYYIDGGEYNFDANGVCTNYNNPVKTPGWHKLDASKYGLYEDEWVYVGSDGNPYVDKWLNFSNSWYYFNSMGYMNQSTDNVPIDGKLYSFDFNGKCKNVGQAHPSGWQEIEHFYETEWIYNDSNGCFITGWKKINNKWYWFNDWDGFMATGHQEIDDKEYYFSDSGEMLTGWIKTDDDEWLYAGSDGSLIKYQWLKYGGSWYYLDYDLVVDTYRIIDRKAYRFDADGKCTNPSGNGYLYINSRSQGYYGEYDY